MYEIPLLFTKQKKISWRNRKTTLIVTKEDYSNIGYIRELIIENIDMPENWQPPIRVTPINTNNGQFYRATLFVRFNAKRSRKLKDGSIVLIWPGLAVAHSWWVEKTDDGFVFNPVLPEKDK